MSDDHEYGASDLGPAGPAPFGLFDPLSLNLNLYLESGPGYSREHKIAAEATLMHERTHWLHHVGTSAGQLLSALIELQYHFLFDWVWGSEPLSVKDFPLLTSERLPTNRRAAWLASELVRALVFGAPVTYCQWLRSQGAAGNLHTLSRELRGYWDVVLRDDQVYDAFQERLFAEASFDEVPKQLTVEDGEGFGAVQLMEVVARVNEIRVHVAGLRQVGSRVGVNFDALWHPPYSTARDVYARLSGKASIDVKDEIAICVLADWALMCPLPPLFPLDQTQERARFPGDVFGFLVSQIDTDALGNPGPSSVGFEPFTLEVYEQVKAKCQINTPIEIAETLVAAMPNLATFTVPDDIYRATPAGVESVDRVGWPRYLSILAWRAAKIRIEHPAFFPLPANYLAITCDFHALWDPLQPPFTSLGQRRFVTANEDAVWFSFFYACALRYTIVGAAATGDVRAIGVQLSSMRGSDLPSETENGLAQAAVVGLLGDGEAARAVLSIAGMAE